MPGFQDRLPGPSPAAISPNPVFGPPCVLLTYLPLQARPYLQDLATMISERSFQSQVGAETSPLLPCSFLYPSCSLVHHRPHPALAPRAKLALLRGQSPLSILCISHLQQVLSHQQCPTRVGGGGSVTGFFQTHVLPPLGPSGF